MNHLCIDYKFCILSLPFFPGPNPGPNPGPGGSSPGPGSPLAARPDLKGSSIYQNNKMV